jgi:hypothetical protein
MLTREQQLAIRLKQADQVIIGLLKIARLAMPDTYWQTDSRVEAARKYLGKKFPKEEEE